VTAPCSLICGHSKKTAWKVFTEHFDLLSSVARVVLLGKISSREKLPPTSNAFKQHLKRCHYQTAVWRQVRIQKLVLPNPGETDWTLAEDLLVPVVMTPDPIPQACLEMVSYQCTTGCATLRCRCKCRKSHVVCTGLCGCTKTDANC